MHQSFVYGLAVWFSLEVLLLEQSRQGKRMA